MAALWFRVAPGQLPLASLAWVVWTSKSPEALASLVKVPVFMLSNLAPSPETSCGSPHDLKVRPLAPFSPTAQRSGGCGVAGGTGTEPLAGLVAAGGGGW